MNTRIERQAGFQTNRGTQIDHICIETTMGPWVQDIPFWEILKLTSKYVVSSLSAGAGSPAGFPRWRACIQTSYTSYAFKHHAFQFPTTFGKLIFFMTNMFQELSKHRCFGRPIKIDHEISRVARSKKKFRCESEQCYSASVIVFLIFLYNVFFYSAGTVFDSI